MAEFCFQTTAGKGSEAAWYSLVGDTIHELRQMRTLTLCGESPLGPNNGVEAAYTSPLAPSITPSRWQSQDWHTGILVPL